MYWKTIVASLIVISAIAALIGAVMWLIEGNGLHIPSPIKSVVWVLIAISGLTIFYKTLKSA